MTDISITCLQDCLARYQSNLPELTAIAHQLPEQAGPDSLMLIIGLYDQCYPILEKAMWSGEMDFHGLLESYQSLFREQDALIQQSGDDKRHDFILSIPVADRPHHLHACLESIHQICKQFGYGGNTSGKYEKIKIIVAEDSRETANIQRHRELINEYQQKGLQIVHFEQDEQYALLQAIPETLRRQLGHLLTDQPKEQFYLKGQAANRNLSYLKMLQLTEDKHRTLYYLVDSDQNFCVNRQTAQGEETVYALNYFYYIDKLFRATDTLIVTGKMVGDPPVSPSVMAANFLDDVIGFFKALSQTDKGEACQFHVPLNETIGDAAYHDMANLFGFVQQHATYPYRCPLQSAHDHVACLKTFTERLNAFFFGEHLTRKTTFDYGRGFSAHPPARTIYPGNYIVNYAGLKYIIPFGHLRLRMSGPTAGRLIAAEIGERFTSLNLPHLHRRTTEAGLDDDFRPGVELAENDDQETIDLSNEFERQFFGDLMLFTSETLVKQADVNQPFEEKLINAIMEEKENELLALYQQKHNVIMAKNQQLDKLVFHSGNWWLEVPELETALHQVKAFIHNIEYNFGVASRAWQQIQSKDHRDTRKHQLTAALLNYRAERNAWVKLFK